MMLRQKNRNKRGGAWQCSGGRDCCSYDHGKESKRLRRVVRRTEKQEWHKEVQEYVG